MEIEIHKEELNNLYEFEILKVKQFDIKKYMFIQLKSRQEIKPSLNSTTYEVDILIFKFKFSKENKQTEITAS